MKEAKDELFARVRAWRDDDPDEAARASLDAMLARDDEASLRALFAGTLTFGTAGLRGPVGPGPLAMNRRVVMQATAGLCAHLDVAVANARARGIVIGFDARPTSRTFAEDAARVAAGLGFSVHLFGEYQPTPVAAYALRALGCAAGLVVTASHNPKEDNGLKVYWENGAQIIPPHDAAIARCIDAVTRVGALAKADLDASPLVHRVPSHVVEAYCEMVLALVPPARRSIRIAYTPLHGVGGAMASSLLARAGFADVHVVASQATPDGTFPTAPFPNPEEPAAMTAVLALLTETHAHIALANDPDADRLAVAIATPEGVRVLDGNEIGAVLTDHRLRTSGAERPLVIATIVSSPFVGAIAASRGARYEQTLTGHKWISARAEALEAAGYELVLGYEEALGYACTTRVRDKDGLSALLLVAAAADDALGRGETLADVLDRLAREVGVFVSRSFSIRHEGPDGPRAMRETLARLREHPPTDIAGAAIVTTMDVLTSTVRTARGVVPLDLPKSDVLIYALKGGARVMLRPSGTEPKLKVYFDVCEPIAPEEAIEDARARANVRLDALIDAMRARLSST